MDFRLNRAIEIDIPDRVRGTQHCTILSTWDSRLTYSFSGRMFRHEGIAQQRRRVFTHFKLLGLEFAYDDETMREVSRDEIKAFRVTPFWGKILKVYFYTRRLYLKTTWWFMWALFKLKLMDTPESRMPMVTDFILFRPFRFLNKPKKFDINELGYPIRKKAK